MRKFTSIQLNDWIKDYLDGKSVNSQEFLEAGCFKMIHAFALLQKTQSEIMIAYVAFRKQVELTYFMSISLFAMGILARIRFLIQEILENIKAAYPTITTTTKNTTMKLPMQILSLKEFTAWKFSKEESEMPNNIKDSSSDDSDAEVERIKTAEKCQSSLSDEFWSKSGAKSNSVSATKKRKIPVDNSPIKKKPKSSKKNDDLDLIFGNLGD